MQGRLAVERIILVTAKGRSRVVINVVTDKADPVFELESAYRLLQKQVAGAIVTHHIKSSGTFRGAIFHVAHVDVDAAAVEKKPAVACWFVPVPVMQIDQAIAIILEKPVSHAWQDFLHLRRRLNQTPILCFQTCNTLGHANYPLSFEKSSGR